MTRYRVEVSPPADKDLTAIKDRVLKTRLMRAVHALGDTPRPSGCVMLVGRADQWRIRVGDWRIVYRVDDGVLVVLVVRVAPRCGVYR